MPQESKNEESKDRFLFKNSTPLSLDFAPAEAGDEEGKRRVRLTALSGEEMFSLWWGKCIFDRSGCTMANAKIPIDYNHDGGEILGYAESASGDPQLFLDGYLIPFKDDRAAEVIHKSKLGQPYQCSVSLAYDGLVTESLSEGMSAQVGEKTVEGPATIFRKYTVDGVAICPYGTDRNTETEIFNQKKGEPMSETKVDTTKFKDEARKELQELFKKFSKKFGPAKAAKYFSDGLDEQQANEEYIAEVAAEVEEIATEIEDKDKTIAEQKSLIDELSAKIAELESAIDAAASAQESASETEMRKRERAAAGFSAGHPKPLSGDTDETKVLPRKFSPLTPGQQLLEGRISRLKKGITE